MLELVERLRRRLVRAFNRQEFERQLEDELRFHVESEQAELVRAGIAPSEASRRALAAFGRFDRWREEARETRLGHWLGIFARDLRLSLRSLKRSPSYTVPTVATLAFGVAALATIVTLAYDVLFRPLPYRDPAGLVAVFERNVQRNRDRNVVSGTAFLAWRQRSSTLDSVSALVPASRVWTTDAGSERVSGAEVSPSLFALLGEGPVLGSGFSASATPDEVILSHRFWSRHLGADSAIIGRRIRLGAEPVAVVGVMPDDFVPLRFGWMGEQEFWTPLVIGPEQLQWGRFLLVVARLRRGASFQASGRELAAIHTQLRGEGSVTDGWDAHLIPLSEEMTGSVRQPFYALLVACVLLLVMVLTNTALLTIAQARRRVGDRMLRTALGATGARLLAERIATTVMLAASAAALGIAASAWLIPILTRFLPTDVPRLDGVRFGSTALLVGMLTALLAALVLTVVPSLDRGRGDASASLLGGARLTGRHQLTWVIVAEAAAAVVLVLFAGLTIRSFVRLSAVDMGFDPTHLTAFRIDFTRPGRERAAARELSRAFFERARAVPGVIAAGRTSVRPLRQGGVATTVAPLGAGDPSPSPTADVRFVDAEYFRALGLVPLAGRLFTMSEREGAPLRVVVNETFGDQLWPGERSPIGRSFAMNLNGGQSPEIIGVVRDVRLIGPRSEPRPTVYIVADQGTAAEEYDVLVRTEGDEGAVLSELRRIAESIAAGTPIFRVERMQQTVDTTVARERATAQLLGFFAMAALLLVAVGVYGLYMGEVTRRRREIGVRMALGQTSAGVARAVVVPAMTRTLIGAAIGVGAGFGASNVLTSVLYGVATTDPLSYVAAAGVVILAALIATVIPTVQATAVEPSLALRSE